ncbi:MAG TPA: hypothetical protein VMH39_14235 [Gemmatimonadaceae bacterium]|nr:hypothetical protein [Gemmatimonadaceae bacterium]
MTVVSDGRVRPAMVADSGAEWGALVDQALFGLHHALNNRIGSLSALVELQQLGDLPPDGTPFETMAADVARLNDCNRMVRLLPRDDIAGEEAVLITDVLADVLAIHRFLHQVRDTAVTVVPTPFVEPIRVERWALVRVLTLLLADVKRQAREGGQAVQVVMESGESLVRIEFCAAGPIPDESSEVDPAAVADRYADRLAMALGGLVTRRRGAAALQLPTLKARRAADRR